MIYNTFLKDFMKRKLLCQENGHGIHKHYKIMPSKNRTMKGLTRITQKSGTIAGCFLIVSELLARLSGGGEFMAGCVTTKRQHHHELPKSGIDRQQQRVVQLKTVIEHKF
jgi:hypothetical protein